MRRLEGLQSIALPISGGPAGKASTRGHHAACGRGQTQGGGGFGRYGDYQRDRHHVIKAR